MYTGATVRKQLYLRDDQDLLLKERARELGASEAELVRHALERLLERVENERKARPRVVRERRGSRG